jgi:DsbC/DsbD-like thiol-disulfide interchange protein
MIIMKAWNSSGRAAAIRAVLASLALAATIGPAATAVPRSTGQSPIPQASEENPLRRVELLVLEDRPDRITAGLHIELDPGWHLYWFNPGDAGLAPEVTWKLPPGFEAGRLRFPTPQKFVHGDLVTYGFTGEALILCDIRRPGSDRGADRPAITAVLGWMACRESCVTGESTARVNLSGLSPADLQKSKSIFSLFSTRYPKSSNPADLTAGDARLIKSSGRWTVEVALSGRKAARVSDFYPYPLDVFVIDHHRIAINKGKLVIPVEPANPAAILSVLSGLLIIDGAGYEVSIPIKE